MKTIHELAIMAELFGFELVFDGDTRTIKAYCEGHLIWEVE